MKPTKIDAIVSIDPDARVVVRNKTEVEWLDSNPNNISEDDIQNKWDELVAEYDAQEYARNRQAEYPDWGSQLNKIYDDGLTKWKSEMVDPVKAKWPKDNSGPV